MFLLGWTPPQWIQNLPQLKALHFCDAMPRRPWYRAEKKEASAPKYYCKEIIKRVRREKKSNIRVRVSTLRNYQYFFLYIDNKFDMHKFWNLLFYLPLRMQIRTWSVNNNKLQQQQKQRVSFAVSDAECIVKVAGHLTLTPRPLLCEYTSPMHRTKDTHAVFIPILPNWSPAQYCFRVPRPRCRQPNWVRATSCCPFFHAHPLGVKNAAALLCTNHLYILWVHTPG